MVAVLLMCYHSRKIASSVLWRDGLDQVNFTSDSSRTHGSNVGNVPYAIQDMLSVNIDGGYASDYKPSIIQPWRSVFKSHRLTESKRTYQGRPMLLRRFR